MRARRDLSYLVRMPNSRLGGLVALVALVALAASGVGGCSKLTSPSEIRVSKEEPVAKPRMADAAVGDPAAANGRAVALKPPAPSACGAR